MKKTLTSILFILSSLACSAEKESGFASLFNGKDLSGWQGMGGRTSNWAAKEGILSCTGKSGSQWIATKEEFSDFDLRLEFKIPVNGNSGVFIRAPQKGAPWVAGMEIQVLGRLRAEMEKPQAGPVHRSHLRGLRSQCSGQQEGRRVAKHEDSLPRLHLRGPG